MTTKFMATCVLKDADWTAITFTIERRKPSPIVSPKPCRGSDRGAAIADPADETVCG